MRVTISLLLVLGVVVGTGFVGCAGVAPNGAVSGDGGTDAAVDAGADSTPADPGRKLSGKTLDYFAPEPPMEGVALASDGIEPALTALSAVGGLYEFPSVATGSKLYVTAAKANYRTTRNAAVSVLDVDVVADFYVMSSVEVTRQYTTTASTPTAGKAFAVAELLRNNGQPFDGLTIATAIRVVDAAGVAVPGVSIFGFGVTDVDPAQTVTTIAGGKVRVGLLDVPAGTSTLEVAYLDDAGVAKTITAPIVATADGATLLVAGGGGGGGGAAITNPTFAANIYPALQKAGAGGLGCANCHTAGGQASGTLQYDLGAAATLIAIKAAPGVLVLTAGLEDTSLFLTKPLYEPAPANHPNATFLDVNDPYYKMWLLWITQGAI